ncbi:hypothetical protein GCM10010302_10690 [Streptomyces polychromogenes]|uniref:Uncharacterized protein n=1 Tax=Streptomyces polychromogenes TaxID=67342 RepID=A0ABN0V4H4_9ACTN
MQAAEPFERRGKPSEVAQRLRVSVKTSVVRKGLACVFCLPASRDVLVRAVRLCWAPGLDLPTR